MRREQNPINVSNLGLARSYRAGYSMIVVGLSDHLTLDHTYVRHPLLSPQSNRSRLFLVTSDLHTPKNLELGKQWNRNQRMPEPSLNLTMGDKS